MAADTSLIARYEGQRRERLLTFLLPLATVVLLLGLLYEVGQWMVATGERPIIVIEVMVVLALLVSSGAGTWSLWRGQVRRAQLLFVGLCCVGVPGSILLHGVLRGLDGVQFMELVLLAAVPVVVGNLGDIPWIVAATLIVNASTLALLDGLHAVLPLWQFCTPRRSS